MRLMLIESPESIKTISKLIAKLDPKTTPEQLLPVAAILADCDPTDRKYAGWIAQLYNSRLLMVDGGRKVANPQLRLPEDTPRIQEAIAKFEKSKPKLPVDKRNIFNFKDFYSLEKLLDQLTAGVGTLRGPTEEEIASTKVIYKGDDWIIYETPKLDGSEQDAVRIKTLEKLGIGTKWCTRENYIGNSSKAKHYLTGEPIFTGYHHGKPALQISIWTKQSKDVDDHDVLVPDELVAPLSPYIGAIISDVTQKMIHKISVPEEPKPTKVTDLYHPLSSEEYWTNMGLKLGNAKSLVSDFIANNSDIFNAQLAELSGDVLHNNAVKILSLLDCAAPGTVPKIDYYFNQIIKLAESTIDTYDNIRINPNVFIGIKKLAETHPDLKHFAEPSGMYTRLVRWMGEYLDDFFDRPHIDPSDDELIFGLETKIWFVNNPKLLDRYVKWFGVTETLEEIKFQSRGYKISGRQWAQRMLERHPELTGKSPPIEDIQQWLQPLM